MRFQRKYRFCCNEQQKAEFALKPLDGLADRGLGCEHDLGSLRKSVVAHDLDEGTQRSELHGHAIPDWRISMTPQTSCRNVLRQRPISRAVTGALGLAQHCKYGAGERVRRDRRRAF
jgi:hypothetical protein